MNQMIHVKFTCTCWAMHFGHKPSDKRLNYYFEVLFILFFISSVVCSYWKKFEPSFVISGVECQPALGRKSPMSFTSDQLNVSLKKPSIQTEQLVSSKRTISVYIYIS